MAGYYGTLLNHSNKVKRINEGAAYGGEFFVLRQTYGENAWNEFFNNPAFGISYLLLDTGSPSYTGYSHCLIPFAEFHLLNNQKPFNLNLRLGCGVGYVEKIYDRDTNPLNLAIGSHFNAAVNVQLQATYRCKDWSLFAGGGINHLSNGVFRIPNAGLNVLTAFAGFNYPFTKERNSVNTKTTKRFNTRNWEKAILLVSGMKSHGFEQKAIYPAGATFELSKRHLDYTRFAATFDLIYDESDYYSLAFLPEYPNYRYEYVKAGFSVGYHLVFHRVSAIFNVGAYLNSKNEVYGKVYQRTGFRYQLTDHLCAHAQLRYQRAHADFVELALGYNW
ncbi:hypothetical protein FACS1894160_2180 [Bacteroidia bacterium]|nr:hypothetical protein FACS1894160_2180 [Bacteroidia bacterium]